jgi:hypothetical protein
MTNMTKTEGAVAVAKLRLKGMNNIQIGETLDRNRNWVGTRIAKARELGLLPPKPIMNRHDQVTLALKEKACDRGSIKQTLSGLSEDELMWLLDQLPAGMSVAELLAAIVKDAYAEEMGE